MFVEIDGVKRGSISNEDCTNTYDSVNGGTSSGGSYCDTTFNIYDPAIVPSYSSSCSNSSDPTCFGRIHIEIDHDWKAAKYCGASTACDDVAVNSQTTSSSVLDVQGFVYWDPGNVNQQWHSFNGWEIHPVTGWRFHQSTASPDFSIAASPSSLAPSPGTTAKSTVTVSSLNGFAGTLSLSATSSPSGPSVSLSPTSVSLSSGSSSISTLSFSSSAAGTYTVTVTGTGSSLTHSTTVNVNVADYSISSSPTLFTVPPGSSGTSTVSLTSLGGFAGTITLTTSVSPSGPTASLSSSTITLSSGGTSTSRLTVSTQSTTAIGNYTVTITGASGSLAHSTTVLVMVKIGPDFSISDNPSSLRLSQSSTASSTITVTSLNGFNGTVTLSVSGAPQGLKTSLSTTSLTLTPGGASTTVLSLKTLHKAQIGTFMLTITATGGGLSHSATLTVTVTA